VGLITGLLTLPLAPVRGTVWIAEQIASQAERERDEGSALRRELAELEVQHDLDEIGDEEYREREGVLLDALAKVNSASAPAQVTDDGR
jgi:hypothetical protein